MGGVYHHALRCSVLPPQLSQCMRNALLLLSPQQVYSVGWMILEAADSDPSLGLRIVQRAEKPVLTPSEVGGWALGDAPALCKQPNIAFVEGAEVLGGDRFRVYFGAADATEGSAVVAVTQQPH